MGIFVSSYNDDIYKSVVFPKEERLNFMDLFDLFIEIITNTISRKAWAYIIVGVGLFIFIWLIFFK